jgi:hypothetical protein
MRGLMRIYLLAVFTFLAGFATGAELPKKPELTEIAKFASPITVSRTIDGMTEGEAFLKTLSPELRAQVEKVGQVMMEENKSKDGKYAGYIKAVDIFKVSKQRAFELIIEPSKQVLYLPRLITSNVVDAPKDGELIEFHIKVLFSNFFYNTRHWFYPEYSRVEWELDPNYKNDINKQVGFWQLYSDGPTRTIAEYGTIIDTGIAVPQSIQNFFARRDIPEAMTAFREYINSDGKYRRED